MDSNMYLPMAISAAAGAIGAYLLMQQKAKKKFSINLGNVIPNFECVTTKGNFKLHDYCTSDPDCSWTLMFRCLYK